MVISDHDHKQQFNRTKWGNDKYTQYVDMPRCFDEMMKHGDMTIYDEMGHNDTPPT